MDYEVYTEDELETLQVIESYSSVNKTKIIGEIIPINHRPSAEKVLKQKVNIQKDESDPWYMEDGGFNFNDNSFYNEVVGKQRAYMDV